MPPQTIFDGSDHFLSEPLLGRESPNLPTEVLFSDTEIKVLESVAGTRRDLQHLNPSIRLNDAVLVVARLGGYLVRKNEERR